MRARLAKRGRPPLAALPETGGSRWLGMLHAALAAAFWSTFSPFTRALVERGVPTVEIGFWRLLVAGLVFALIALREKSPRPQPRELLAMLLLGGGISALLTATFQLSIALSGGATAVVLLYTAPAWVVLFSRLLFGEAVSRAKLAAVGVALAGVVFVSLSGGSLDRNLSPAGVICGLVAGFAYAACFPYTAWFGARFSSQTLYACAFLGAAAFLAPFALPLSLDKPAEVWELIGLMSLVGQLLAYYFLARSLKRLSQVQSAVIGNLEPVLGTLWVCALFGEYFSPSGWLGCALILGAVLLLALERRPASA